MSDERLVETGRTYDGIAVEYAERSTTSEEVAAFRHRAADRLRGPVADLGCGPGQHAEALTARGLDVVGLDISVEMLRLAAARGTPVVRADLRDPPLRGLGGIWCCAALLHVPREQTVATLAAWRRCVAPGAALALTTSGGTDQGWEAVPYGPGQGPTGDTRLRRWFVHRTSTELLGALAEAGWHVDEVGTRRSHRTWLTVLASARGQEEAWRTRPAPSPTAPP